MDINSVYSSGSAIQDLRNLNKAVAETNFNEMIDEINTKATDEENLYGSLQKAGASITAVGAIGKGVLTQVKKLKSKITGQGEEEEASEEGLNVSEEGGTEISTTSAPQEIEMSGTVTETPYITSEIDDVATAGGGDDVGNIADLEGGLVEEGAGDLGNYTAPFLQSTGATTDIPAEETFEPAMEGVDLSADATLDAAQSGLDSVSSGLGDIISSAQSALSSATEAASSAVSSAVNAASGAVSGAVDAATGAATGAAEVGGEVAAGAALESAGTALDSTGVGAPVGLIMNLIGGLILGGSMAAGIAGEVSASNEQQTATQAAQNTLHEATSGGLSTLAGRYGV